MWKTQAEFPTPAVVVDLDVVEKLVTKALSEDADVVLYDMRYVYENKQFVVHQTAPLNKEVCVKHTLTFKMSVCVCGGLYLSSLFKDTKVKFVEGLNFGEDYVVKPRILYFAKKIAHCSGCYYNYVQYNSSSYTVAYRSKNVDDLINAVSILNDFFNKCPDSSIYKDAMQVAFLYVKVKLLIAICLHRKEVWCRMPMVANLYRDLDIDSSKLPFSYRIVLKLANIRFFDVLYLYVNAGFKLKQMLK